MIKHPFCQGVKPITQDFNQVSTCFNKHQQIKCESRASTCFNNSIFNKSMSGFDVHLMWIGLNPSGWFIPNDEATRLLEPMGQWEKPPESVDALWSFPKAIEVRRNQQTQPEMRLWWVVTPNNSGVPSGKLTLCYWKWLFLVDLPIKNGRFPCFLVCLPEGTFIFTS